MGSAIKIFSTFFIAIVIIAPKKSLSQNSIAASQNLIQRILPAHVNDFVVEQLAPEKNKEAFEIESRNNKIVLRGNNGVAVAAALYYYLTEFCHCQVTWNGTNLHLPKQLPIPLTKIHKETPYSYRYYLNYCTFNYSMSWWDWPRWEKEIDWMALHGINMPLAITGEEYTWREVYHQMGFTDDDLKDFFSGPAYFSWFWMGNIDGWGGPLPVSWMESHRDLQQKILQRERELGMKPALPAFTGHVPAAFKKKFPNAKLKVANWKNGFGDTYILDSEDSLFAELGKKFLQEQTKLFGTDHLYSADTFNENEPASDDPEFLSKLSGRVYEGMYNADTAATWVMQAWLFFSDRKFWKAPQIEALLKAVPDDKMILLDLAAEIEPVWKRTNAFHGKQWIWNMINNFGGNTNLFGRMDAVAKGPALALKNDSSKNMAGIGMTMEGIEQNPVIYELMTANTWRDTSINLEDWLAEYTHNRYGVKNLHARKAWDILRKTAYSVPPDKYKRDGAESIIQARPTFDSSSRWANTKLNYNAADLLPAWDEKMKAMPACKNSNGFLFDLVDIARQVLANYASPLQQKFAAAYRNKDLAAFKKYSTAFIQLMDDMDKLLATRKDFLLGPWVADARKWGKNENEKLLYEMNAKDLITLWGDENCPLNEYACRQWSGLINDFYKPRWKLFFEEAEKTFTQHQGFDMDSFTQKIKKWEWQWVHERKDYPVSATGDATAIVRLLYQKYRSEMQSQN